MQSQRYEVFDEVKVTAAAAVESDEVAELGDLIGVAKSSAAIGEDVMYATKGVFALAKKAAITPDQGTPVFWDSDPGEITGTAADGVYAGVVYETPAAGDATVKVAINERVPGAHVANTAAADVATLVTDFNGLLTALRNAGVLKSS
jgi:predicted RecA/RadA family phage recombinase